jgi:hypothetical protein
MLRFAARGALLLAGVLILIILLAGAALGWRALRRHQVSEAMVIDTPNGIDERRYVRIGGV